MRCRPKLPLVPYLSIYLFIYLSETPMTEDAHHCDICSDIIALDLLLVGSPVCEHCLPTEATE